MTHRQSDALDNQIYKLFSNTHRKLTDVVHMMNHKQGSNVPKTKILKISMVSGHSGIKIKVNSNMKLGKSPTIWKLSSTVLSGNGYSRNGDGIRKCFELNNENATCENADPSTFRRERVQRW